MSDFTADSLVGRLTLADAMLCELVVEMRRVLAYADWPGTERAPRAGDTTSVATDKLERDLSREAALETASLLAWIADVKDVLESRNRVIHAIALDQCMRCGEATMFQHPRSGHDVDRSPQALQAILNCFDDLRERANPLAAELSLDPPMRSVG